MGIRRSKHEEVRERKGHSINERCKGGSSRKQLFFFRWFASIHVRIRRKKEGVLPPNGYAMTGLSIVTWLQGEIEDNDEGSAYGSETTCLRKVRRASGYS